MTLFISGLGGKTDVVSGFTVQVEENNNGIFKITNPPSKMPNGVSSAEVIFVCVDLPDGSKLMTMSSSNVFAVNLPGGGTVPTEIKRKNDVLHCIRSGSTYVSSSTPLYYYMIDSDGALRHTNVIGKNISSSFACGSEFATKLCINENKLKVKVGCQGSTIPNLVSGYVSDTTAYLFDTANTVYVFDSSVFTSEQSVDLKKVISKEAWKGATSVQSSSKPEPEPKVKSNFLQSILFLQNLMIFVLFVPATSANDKSTIIFVMFGILALLLIFFCIFVYCCFFRGDGKKSSKKKGKQAVSRKKNKSKKSFKKAVGSKKKSTISKSSRSASKKTSTSRSRKKGSNSSKSSKSLKGKSSKSSINSKVKSSKIKSSKGKGSVTRGRRSSTKLPKKSVTRKTTAFSSR